MAQNIKAMLLARRSDYEEEANAVVIKLAAEVGQPGYFGLIQRRLG